MIKICMIDFDNQITLQAWLVYYSTYPKYQDNNSSTIPLCIGISTIRKLISLVPSVSNLISYIILRAIKRLTCQFTDAADIPMLFRISV